MLFQIKSYLHFLWNSKNEHGVHSPFVFSLVTKCFYDKKNKPEYAIIKDYRLALLKNKNTINVTDLAQVQEFSNPIPDKLLRLQKQLVFRQNEPSYYSE